jgi:hypothetical protein
MDPRCTLGEAVDRARSIVGKGGQYILGTGDYRPKGEKDEPWTQYWDKKSPWYQKWGSDCAGFAICWAWKLRRHRPGFNVGPWATVSEDINCNSALEDGLHKQELFVTLPEGACVRPGDLILYPTIVVNGKKFIGHVGLIETMPIKLAWGDWSELGVIQCRGGNGRTPGVIRTDGSLWEHHDTLWGKPAHRTSIVRVKERL